MSATVPQLAARVLRRLGLSLVAQNDRAALGPTSTAADVAAMVLRDRQIPVPEANRPDALAPFTQAQVATAALRLLGINQASNESLGTADNNEIIARALRLNSVNPADISLLGGYSSGVVFLASTIATRALQKLGVIAADETPSPEDATLALDAVTSIHEMLVAEGTVAWGDNGVPEGAVESYVLMAAHVLAPAFGLPTALDNFNAAHEMLNEQALSGANAVNRASVTLSAVHGDLAGRGIVDWQLNAIPTGALESYVTMVADRLAPSFEKPRNQQAYAEAEMQVRLFALSGPLGQVTAQDKVAQAHESLNALGLVSWPLTAIPAAYVNDYAVMASVFLAAIAGMPRDAQGRQVDTSEWDAAVGHVKAGAMVAGMQDRALAKVQAVHNEMLAMGLVSWTLDAIPASLSDAYAEAATALMGAENKELDPKAQQAAYARIRMVAMNGPAGQALAEEKVREAHFEWAGRGKVQWTLLNIPRYAERLYVDKAASLLAPEMAAANALAPEANVGMFMQLAVAAERSLAQITMVPSNGRPVVGVYF